MTHTTVSVIVAIVVFIIVIAVMVMVAMALSNYVFGQDIDPNGYCLYDQYPFKELCREQNRLADQKEIESEGK
ncbi:MAG TPA: hypothetical protein VL854_11615 [Nitrososphaeraceae archaeon]|nr:hypothetical protein [Nitrososphaeraceae archaeon]